MLRKIASYALLGVIGMASLGESYAQTPKNGFSSAIDVAPFQISRRLKFKEIRPVQGKTKKRYEVWWVAIYRDGSRKTFWDSPPNTRQNILKVFKYENNLERTLYSSGRGGAALLLNPKVVTYELFTFWTGKTWMEERELIQKAPKIHKELLKKARKEHLETDKVLHWLRWAKSMNKYEYEYQLARYELKNHRPKDSLQLKELTKRVAWKKSQIQVAQKEMKAYNKNYPARSIMDALRLDEEINDLEVALKNWRKERGNIVKKLKSLNGLKKKDYQLKIEWTDKDLEMIKKALGKLKKAEVKLKKKGLLLPD